MNKKQLRQQIKQRLLHMTKEERKKKENIIHDILFHQHLWQTAQVIGITISQQIEIDTKCIIERAWQEGKKVAIPKCDVTTKQMTFREIRSFQETERSFFDLYEPIVEETREVQKHEIELLFVPGLAFVRKGYRLGYGGGYYDRYLVDFPNDTISLAYDCQIVSTLPVEQHDIPVQMIITNEGIVVCENE
ncbi:MULTISPECIES: 5-formyltetrahydrofolate cyclo-ligase [Anoxybacillus]|uniref:5-formyltetrahydrofolate cyclo-ligase n=1 Tax=Anoxybacillus kestanbolensis TaxID=227476 RepID=A0A1V3FTH6_9BACL|nr:MULTISPECIES: 5-formyltetrahydrofolate cyclo-ligase [Anoxybacillus]NNU89167.1 5-formyltetrahydrofolate cyclo-ligase [Anoxybacillus sp. CHMUD]OOE04935.1 5-formyltetrahydrofolate cyclo-ligase [Anoxybacillus kestanbolensis]